MEGLGSAFPYWQNKWAWVPGAASGYQMDQHSELNLMRTADQNKIKLNYIKNPRQHLTPASPKGGLPHETLFLSLNYTNDNRTINREKTKCLTSCTNETKAYIYSWWGVSPFGMVTTDEDVGWHKQASRSDAAVSRVIGHGAAQTSRHATCSGNSTDTLG